MVRWRSSPERGSGDADGEYAGLNNTIGARTSFWRGWRGDAAALICGALLPLAYAPFGWFPVAFFSLACCWLLCSACSSRRALVRGWWYGLGMFGIGVSWVYVSIHHYGDASLAASISIALAMVAILAVYIALFAWAVNRLGSRASWWTWLGLAPAAWVLIEWLRGWLFTGFPWLNLGYSQIDSPLLGFAPVLGVYGVSWAVALSAGLLVQAWLNRRRPLPLIVAFTTLSLLWVLGAVFNTQTWSSTEGKRIRVSLLQGNIAQDMKWRSDQQLATVDLYASLSRDSQKSRLIIWPETAIPAFYHQVEDSLIPQLMEVARRWNADMLIGIPVLDRDSWQYYNAVMSVGREHAFYHKQHLVPFGEYMPMRPMLEKVLSAIDLAMADFSEGEPDQTLLRGARVPIGTSICYEVAFGEEVIRALPEAALLVNVSNDAWFGDSLAPHQHLEIARMRARETERYMLRATNTGISAIIDHKGRVQARSEQFAVAVLTDKVQPRKGATPYVGWGNGPVVVGALLVCLLSIGVGHAGLFATLARAWKSKRLRRA